MYGHIHVILKDLIMSIAGPAKWQGILQEAGLGDAKDEARILDTVVHGDEVTFRLVGATCKVLGLSADEAIAAFGRHFVVFALRSGNARFLRAQGATLPTFLANVNNLHHHLERDHPDARFPFLEAKYDPVQDRVQLTYYSTREGLASLVVGVVQEIGKRLYGLDVSLEAQEVPEGLREAKSMQRAAAWLVSWRPRPGGPEALEPSEQATATKMSFAALHSAMADFGRLLRSAEFWAPCSTCTANGCGAADALEFCTAEPSPRRSRQLQKRTSARKLEELMEDGALPERILLRAVRAQHIAAAWSDTTLPRCRPFWQSPEGRGEDYELSEDCNRVDVFVSHSWNPPENWALVMGGDVNHADVKSTTLAIMAKDIALARNRLEDWGEVTFWVDKACIPQDDPELKEKCIMLIERFVHHCDYICVLFTWSYLERLWCVFEWACFLVDKEPSRVWLQNELFVKEQTLPLYLENVRYFSLRRAKCYLESDRVILQNKIDTCYVSHRAFEELVQATAVALMARSMAHRAGRSAHLLGVFFTPWVELAKELGFHELVSALQGCRPLEWREEAAALNKEVAGDAGGSEAVPVLLGRVGTQMGISASKYHDRINHWFDSEVNPVLNEIRRRAVRN